MTKIQYIGTIDSGLCVQIRPYRKGDTHKKVFGCETECNNFYVHSDGVLVCGRLINITKRGVRDKVAEHLAGMKLDREYTLRLLSLRKKERVNRGEEMGIGPELTKILSGTHNGD